jgi:hypothetical protein
MARNAEFQAGMSGSPNQPSLNADSQKQNALAKQAALTPHSVLSAYMNIKSPTNGNAPADAARQTPTGQLPSMNGTSPNTYSQLYPTKFGTRLNVA